MEKRRQIILRFALIFIAITLGFLLVLVQIVRLQTVERKKWLNAAPNQEAVQREIAARRGNIYDSDGRLLAGSLPRYTLTWDSRVEALHRGGDTLFYHNLDSIAAGLSRIFRDKSAAAYREQFKTAFRRHDGRMKIQPYPVSYTEMKQVKALPLFRRNKYTSGLIIEESHKRIKPFGNLASRTIGGIYGETGLGNSGLEKRYDRLLAGEPGLSERRRVAGRTEYVTIDEPRNGVDILTCIDANLQDLAETMLRRQIEAIEGEWGCCILMEVQTGEVKAICNLDRTSEGTYREMINHAVKRYEPGSTFKTVSLMAALDDGKINYERDTFRVYKDGWKYQDAVIRDAHPADTVYHVIDALAVSSNIALAKIVTQSYEGKAARFAERVRRIGICDSIPCEIPGAEPALLADPRDMATLAKMSYGYSVEMSPLQILTFYNGIANNGKMISPLIVKEIQENGKTIEKFESQVLKQSLCKSNTLHEIQESLHAVVWDNELGTASVLRWNGKIVRRKAQSPLVHIAGKTGTAQVFENGRYSSRHHRIVFVGYFPEEEPQYSCICVIHHPHQYGMYDAGLNCGTVVRQIAEHTIAYTGITDSEELEIPYDSIDKPRVKGGRLQSIHRAAKGADIRVGKAHADWALVEPDMQIRPVVIEEGKIPNVLGMSAMDAVYAIEQTGMRAQIQGKGRVWKQSMKAGEPVLVGQTVWLELR